MATFVGSMMGAGANVVTGRSVAFTTPTLPALLFFCADFSTCRMRTVWQNSPLW